MRIFLILSCFLLSTFSPIDSDGQLSIPDSLLKFKEERDVVVGIKQSEPFIIIGEDGTPTGLSVELWEGIAQDLDITYQYKVFDTLNLLLNAVETDQVDISINPLTVTPERLIKMEFSQPFFITNLAIAIPKQEGYSFSRVFQLIFSPQFLEILLFLSIIILFFGFLAWIFERKHNKEQFGQGLKGLWESFWWSAVTMTTVGYGDKAPKSVGGRIVGLFWMFSAIVLIGVFTGTVASLLTVDQLSLDINDLNDLKEARVLTIKSSTSEEYLKSKGIETLTENDLKTALKRLNNGEVDALIYDEPLLRYMIEDDEFAENLTIAPAKFLTQYYAYAVPLKQEKIQVLNLAMIKRIESIEWRRKLIEYGLD